MKWQTLVLTDLKGESDIIGWVVGFGLIKECLENMTPGQHSKLRRRLSICLYSGDITDQTERRRTFNLAELALLHKAKLFQQLLVDLQRTPTVTQHPAFEISNH